MRREDLRDFEAGTNDIDNASFVLPDVIRVLIDRPLIAISRQPCLEDALSSLLRHASVDVDALRPCCVADAGVTVVAAEEGGAGDVEVAGHVFCRLRDFPELVLGEGAGCAGGVDLIVVFDADVVVQEVVEEVADDGDVGFDLRLKG